MNRKGVDFTLAQTEPGSWKWRFQIGEAVSTGKTQVHLMGLAAHRVQQLIDRELEKPRPCEKTVSFLWNTNTVLPSPTFARKA